MTETRKCRTREAWLVLQEGSIHWSVDFGNSPCATIFLLKCSLDQWFHILISVLACVHKPCLIGSLNSHMPPIRGIVRQTRAIYVLLVKKKGRGQ